MLREPPLLASQLLPMLAGKGSRNVLVPIVARSKQSARKCFHAETQHAALMGVVDEQLLKRAVRGDERQFQQRGAVPIPCQPIQEARPAGAGLIGSNQRRGEDAMEVPPDSRHTDWNAAPTP